MTAEELVSCIMPTADRRRFVPDSIRLFLAQDFPRKELVILDDGADSVADLIPPDPRIRYFRDALRAPVGTKRNRACAAARGEIIAHWDDDDFYAPWRLAYQVAALRDGGTDICGLDRPLFRDEADDTTWEYVWPKEHGAWLHGATLCYRRALWKRHPFAPLAIGEDLQFLNANRDARLTALTRTEFYIGRIHAKNTSPKQRTSSRWRRCDSAASSRDTPAVTRTALVAAAAGIGDILRATPLIRALRLLGYRVDVLLAPDTAEAADLLRGAPEINRLTVAPPLRQGTRAPPVPELRCQNHDVLVTTFWAEPFADKIDAKRHFGFERKQWLERGDTACLAAIAETLGWHGPLPPAFARISDRRFNLPPGTVALHPGGKPDWPWKRWHGFPDLAAMTQNVVVIGTEADRDNAKTYFSEQFRWPAHVRDMTGKLSLRDTAALISQCAALVSNDSGLMHLGVALGVRTLGVFGITSPAREAMPSPAMIPVTKGLDCEPDCRRQEWGRRDCARHLECLRTLTAAEVKARLDDDPEMLRVTYNAPVFDATGYGQAARLYVRALHAAGVRVAVSNTGAQPPQVEDTLVASLLGNDDDADFHIFHGIPAHWARAAFPRRRVIAVTVWETDAMPQQWRGVLTHATDVWLPCRHNVDVFARALGRAPFLLPHALSDTFPAGSEIRIPGIADTDFVFFAIFEWQERKNPDGTLEAFLRAFPVPDDAVLALKCGPHSAEAATAALAAARARTGSRGRVLLFAESWSAEQMESLQARGNCYVSLHKGEGWGYPLFEAAARGTPVIATAYAGPLDFLDANNHFLVRHRRVPVRQRYVYYHPSMHWAEPDLGHAAQGMRWVFDHRAQARERAEAAALGMRQEYALETIGAAAKARLLALRDPSPPRDIHPAAPPAERLPPPVPIPGSWYDADYFEHGRTSNWARGYHWAEFATLFENTAAWIATCFPDARAVLDIGCAKGFLVRALRARGLFGTGFDHSAWAIDHADPEARPYLTHAGVDDVELSGSSDIASAFFVLESLTEAQLRAFLRRLRGHVRQALVAVIAPPATNAKSDRDPTRVTQRDRAWWRALFRECGWTQDPIHLLYERHCAAQPLPQRMGWSVHVFTPGA